MQKDLMFAFVILLTTTFILKLFFWLLIADVKKRVNFVTSFLRLYSIYQMHDAPSKRTVIFWKASNILNVLFWIFVLCIGFLYLNQFLKDSTDIIK